MALSGPVKLAPIPMARPWGGRLLHERFGKPLPPDGQPLGESWEACDFGEHVSRVASGPHAGKTVRELLDEPLPLLVKLLHAAEPISVQVHPDEFAVQQIGGEARSKTEAWHVLWSEPGAEVIYGARKGTSTQKLLDGAEDGAIEPLLKRYPATVGDTIFIPAGTVHSVSGGVIVYEVQEPADTTYRLYDWGRVGLDGKPRPLHLGEAARAIRGPVRGDPRRPAELTPGANPRILLVRCPAFRLELQLCDAGEVHVKAKPRISCITAVGGAGTVFGDEGSEAIERGETFLIPAGGEYALRPGPRGLRLVVATAGGVS